MQIDPLREKVIPLRQLRKVLPETPAYTTIWSWYRYGRRNRYSHKLIKLETIRLPSGLCSTAEAYVRFVEALNRLSP